MNNDILERNEAAQSAKDNNLLQADLISSIIIFCFGLFVLITGVYIAFFAVSGTDVWYYSPGMFPMVVGFALIVLSVILFRKKRSEGARFVALSFSSIKTMIRSKKNIRLLLAITLFAVYVFGTLGRLPFVVATFLYLFVTMIVFRTEKYALWKIAVISLVTTSLIYFFFGVVASVPLP